MVKTYTAHNKKCGGASCKNVSHDAAKIVTCDSFTAPYKLWCYYYYYRLLRHEGSIKHIHGQNIRTVYNINTLLLLLVNSLAYSGHINKVKLRRAWLILGLKLKCKGITLI